MRVGGRRLILVMTLAAVASACGSGSHPPPSPAPAKGSIPTVSLAPTTSSTTTTTVAPTTTSTGTGSSSGGCASDQLLISFVGEQGAAGSEIGIYAFQNTTNSPCTLVGYPGMQMLNANGQTIPTKVVRQPDPFGPPSVVTLSPGGDAYFVIQYPDGTGYAGLSCPTSSSIEFTAPNDYQPLVLSGKGAAIQPFGGTTNDLKCGQIEISPVLAKNPEASSSPAK